MYKMHRLSHFYSYNIREIENHAKISLKVPLNLKHSINDPKFSVIKFSVQISSSVYAVGLHPFNAYRCFKHVTLYIEYIILSYYSSAT